MLTERVLQDNGYEKRITYKIKIRFLWQNPAAREVTHHPHYKICSRHFLLLLLCTFDWFHLQSPIKIYYKDPFFCCCCSGGSMYQTPVVSKDVTNLDMLSFCRFSRHSATVIWFYMFVYLKRMMKIVAMIPGSGALCAAWGETACIFCASASRAVFCLPFCQDSLKTLYRSLFKSSRHATQGSSTFLHFHFPTMMDTP